MKKIKIIIFVLFVMSLVGCNTLQSSTTKTEAYRLSAFSMPLQTEYSYDYLGFRFQLGEEINQAIQEDKLLMYLDAGYEQQSQELAYARQAIVYIPKEYRQKTWDNEEQIQSFRDEAQKFGCIGVYKRSVLEETDIETLTNCTENKNIGETPDGTWQYYISSNDIAEVHQETERFRKTLVTIYDMTPFAEGISIFAEARTIEQNIGDIQTTDIYGNAVTKDIFSDYDLTLVNIFTTSCSPCLQQMPELEALHNDPDLDVQIVSIVYDAAQQPNDDIIELAKLIQQELNITYPFIVPDTVLMEGRLKGVTAFPETFFVDRQGNIVGQYYLGARPKEDWLEVIQKERNNMEGENTVASEETEGVSEPEQ